MRKRIAVLAFLVATVVLLSLGGSSASIKTDGLSRSGPCPRGSHLITCGTQSWCCPDNALCVCGPQ